jgi:Cytochrome P460
MGSHGLTSEGTKAGRLSPSVRPKLRSTLLLPTFRSGLPSSGTLCPDGSKIAKIEWSFKRNTVSPYSVNVPDTLQTIAFIEKDTIRFPNTHGWAYAAWDYDPATNTFKPASLSPSGTECGFASHTTVAAQDYISRRIQRGEWTLLDECRRPAKMNALSDRRRHQSETGRTGRQLPACYAAHSRRDRRRRPSAVWAGCRGCALQASRKASSCARRTSRTKSAHCRCG